MGDRDTHAHSMWLYDPGHVWNLILEGFLMWRSCRSHTQPDMM